MTIVIPVDSGENIDFILDEGRELAEAFNEELHVVHVLNRESYYDLNRTSVENQHTTVMNEEIEETAAEIAKEAVGSAGSDVTPVGRMGKPAEEIVQYAREQDARYIVVGSRKRTPIGKAVFGSVVQSIILEADQPVVTVRKDDF